jgi:hypothetical protein
VEDYSRVGMERIESEKRSEMGVFVRATLTKKTLLALLGL